MAEMNNPATGLRILMARGFRSRLVGLLGRSSMDVQQGLWLEPCRCVIPLACDLGSIWSSSTSTARYCASCAICRRGGSWHAGAPVP